MKSDLNSKLQLVLPSKHLNEVTGGSSFDSKTNLAHAMKRSSDYALATTQLDYEQKIKRLSVEKMALTIEKDRVQADQQTLKLKNDLLSVELHTKNAQVVDLQKKFDDRLSSILKSTNDLQSNLCDELQELREESIKHETDYTNLQLSNAQLKARVVELETVDKSRTARLTELENFVKENEKNLEKYAVLDLTVKKLKSENAALVDQLAIERNRLKIPARCSSLVKGPSYLAKLELEYDSMKAAFNKLSQERATWLVTQEENADLLNQVEMLKQWRQRALIAENQLLEKDTIIAATQSLCNDIGSPVAKVRRLSKENEVLLAEQGDLRSRNEEFCRRLEEAQKIIQGQTNRLNFLEPEVEALKQLHQRDVQQNLLLMKERDLYKNLLTSLDVHELVPSGVSNQVMKRLITEKLQSIKQLRSELVEHYDEFAKSHQAYSSRVTQLIHSMEVAKDSSSRNHFSTVVTERVDSYERKLIAELRHQISEYEQSVEKLQTEKRSLEDKLETLNMKGDYDPQKTKILTLKANPAAMVRENLTEELTKLRHVNERQRQRIQVLEDRLTFLTERRVREVDSMSIQDDTTNLDVTATVDKLIAENPDPLSEIADLKQKLQVERFRSDRLMELFDKASARFRTCCRDLLGYRLDVHSNGDCKVQPTLTNDTNDYVLIKKVDGKFQVVETIFTESLPHDIRSYLNENYSIPGFFASLTLYFLQQATMIT